MDIDFLKKLVATPSPSGFEQPLQKLVREKFDNSADEVKTDVNGNVFGIINANGKPRIMVAAHSDEIGFMVKHITDEGYVYFAAVGGVDISLMPGQKIEIHTGRGIVRGIVGKKPIHLMDEEDKKKKQEIYNIWIDIGAGNKKKAEKIISIGDPITFSGQFNTLQSKQVTARSFDDKAGIFILTEIMKSLSGENLKAAVFCVSTVQEELGLRGATTSAYEISPDIGIAVDVEFSSDYPDIDKRRVGEISLGKGPVLYKGANINPVIGELLIQTAEKKKIPYQLSGSPKATGTDANVMQLTRSGVATALVGIPNRYMHTPVEVVSLTDLENTVKLLTSFILKLDKHIELVPGNFKA